MSLVHEAVIIQPTYRIGDVKIANYDIVFTINQLIEPNNDPGWFLLNGAVINQTSYPILFAQFGSTFNTGGEGAGNFRLPDHTEGRFPLGKGLTNFTSYGAVGGEIAHVLSLGEMPIHGHGNTLGVSAGSHNHSASGTTDFGGAHTHSYTRGFTQASTPTGTSSQIAGTSYPVSTGGEAGHSHWISFSAAGNTESYNKSGSISIAGSSTAHNNLMPYIVIGGILVRHD